LLPPTIYIKTLFPYYIFTAAGLIYCLWVGVQAVRCKIEGSVWFLVGFGIFLVTAVLSILYAMRIVQVGYVLPLGVITMAVSQAFMLARKLIRAYAMLKEHKELKQELARRKATELDLRLTHKRLASILNILKDVVLVVNESFEVTYVNSRCEELLDKDSEQLLGKPVASFFPTEQQVKLEHSFNQALKTDDSHVEMIEVDSTIVFQVASGKEFSCTMRLGNMDLDDESLLVIILAKNDNDLDERARRQEKELAGRFFAELKRNRMKVKLLEEYIEGAQNTDHTRVLASTFKELDSAIDSMEQNLVGAQKEIFRRELGIKGLQLALQFWEDSTGLTKIELARQSGLWKVYTNHNGHERTQTLDKYLNPELMPKIPRWRKIFETIDFVLSSCPQKTALRKALEATYSQLQAM